VPWYFVCATCGAKWFSETRRGHCPRCQTGAVSTERLRPPWWRSSTKSGEQPTTGAAPFRNRQSPVDRVT